MPLSAHRVKSRYVRIITHTDKSRADIKAHDEDGATYTDEEREFLVAIDRYKRANRRPFPTWVEGVVKALGYRKPP